MFRRKGFTLIELLTVMAIIALLLGILLPALTNARARARVLKDATQLKGIHQAWVTKSIDYPNEFPTNPLPTPGLVNRTGRIVGRGEEDTLKNDHASLFSMSVAQNLFSAPLCVGPSEVSPNVTVCTNFDMTRYLPAEDCYWDGDTAGERVFDDAVTRNFRANLMQGANTSYAVMPLVLPTDPTVGVGNSRRVRGWKNGGVSTMAVLGNRGVQDGIDGSTGGDINIFKNSRTLDIHGAKGSWEGNLVYGDNRVDYSNSFYNSTPSCVKANIRAGAGTAVNADECARTVGSGFTWDNIFREDDTKGQTDSWLCVIPALTSTTVNGRARGTVPTSSALLYD
ncbi:MAG: prepilin-type N-terminal cleavage/methylation domain-containing protein [Planctomycetes bacterium]|nr:prepilin-type N-terminal cleavage/methylation domain-containing protein [Planctomycetota bacterium]